MDSNLRSPVTRTYANTEIAADRERFAPAPRTRRLDGKGLCRDGHRYFGSEDPGCRPKFVQTAIFGALVFFCVGFICKHRRIPAPRMADGLRTKERRLK